MNFNFSLILKNYELKKKIFVTFFLIFIYRLGIFISIPGVNLDYFKNAIFNPKSNNVINLFNLFSGGALENFSIFALGIMPYITSSIIISLLVNLVPYFEEIYRDGFNGIKKINFYIKILSFFVSIFQSLVMIKFLFSKHATDSFLSNHFWINSYNGWLFFFISILSFVTGSMFVIWLSDCISLYGVGSGVSLIIFSGIVSKIPSFFYKFFFLSFNYYSFFLFFICFLLFFLFVFFIIFIEKSYREISLIYCKSNVIEEGYNSDLTFKLNSFGIMPVIFSSTLIIIINFLFNFLGFDYFFINYFFSQTSILYNYLFFVLIFFFTYFYSNIHFNIREISENITKSGFYLFSIKSGHSSINFIKFSLYRINFFCSFYLFFICLLPVILSSLVKDNSYLNFLNGASILILISVCLEIIKNVENFFFIKNYNIFDKK